MLLLPRYLVHLEHNLTVSVGASKCKSWFAHCRAEWRQLQAALGSNDRALVCQCRRACNTASCRWKCRLANEFALKLVNAACLNPRGFWRYAKGQQQQTVPFSFQDLTEYWRHVLGPPARGHLPDLYRSVEELLYLQAWVGSLLAAVMNLNKQCHQS